MGVPSPGAADAFVRAISGSFSAVGAATQSTLFQNDFNVTLWGTFVGTVRLECSYDGGTTFVPCAFSDGTIPTFSAPISLQWDNPESGVLFRPNCTAWTSGTINWRLSK